MFGGAYKGSACLEICLREGLQGKVGRVVSIRAAVLTDLLDSQRVALWRALTECPAVAEVYLPGHKSTPTCQIAAVGAEYRPGRNAPILEVYAPTLESELRGRDIPFTELRGRWRFGSISQLIVHRPDLIICEDFGWPALQAACYRLLARRSRLLLFVTEPPRRAGLRARFVLGAADGVLADGNAVADSVAQLGFPVSRTFPLVAPYELGAFSIHGQKRPDCVAHRLIYAGDLSPRSGAADLLMSVVAWAECNSGRAVEIWWAGDGDLASVLAAQPLPDGVSQRFLGRLDSLEMAQVFGQCGVFVVPSLDDGGRPLVDEALAAGLPVLGSTRSRRVRQLVREGVHGWLFDPLRRADFVAALDRAMATPAEQLDHMRDNARALVGQSAFRVFAERIRRAVATVLPDVASEPGGAGNELEPVLQTAVEAL